MNQTDICVIMIYCPKNAATYLKKQKYILKFQKIGEARMNILVQSDMHQIIQGVFGFF